MTSIANSTVVKVAAVVAGLALAFSFSIPAARAAGLTESNIQAILALLSSFGADTSTVANVEASLRGTTPSAPSTPSSSASCYSFTRDLTVGSQGADVTALQAFLRSKGNFTHPTDTGYFGSVTQTAVSAWQTASGVSPAAGYFGSISRAKYGTQCTSGPTTSTPTTPTAPGTGVAVSAGSQPANALAPEGASRVPFTNITLTAGNDGDVTVNSITVQRVGLGSNAAFSGVTLIDQDGNQLGTARTFNSNDQATIGEKVVIPRGQSRTFMVAANMASSLDSYSGEAPGIKVISVNTTATVTGSLPITGAYHTMNATLSVGSVTLSSSNANATNANATKEIGTTGYKTTGVRLTAGSAEDLRLKMIRFNQTGSASTLNDLANVMVNVGGTGYPVTVSADGKYVTANFGAGVLVPQGNSVEIYVKYDIVGSGAANRTVIFDIDKTTDIFFQGETYGYGVSPAAGSSSVPTSRGTFTVTSGTPYIYSTQVTISGASVTTIAKATTVAAQNIAVNLQDQPLGGFVTDIKGEPITVQSMVFTVASTTGSGTGLLTNVKIVDQNGTIVAGPIDADYTSALVQTLTFTDSVTIPTGKMTYTIVGKVASGIGNGGTYIVSTNPNTGWTNAKGDITGNSVTFSQTSFSMNTMTVKGASLAVGRAANPANQTVVAGGQGILMVNYQLDATQSGEDVRLSSMPVLIEANADNTTTEGDYDYLTSCQLFDGATALNTGSNVLNPTGATTTADYTDTAVFDNPVQVAKGTVKTLGMKCNISASTPSGDTFTWDHGSISTFASTGAVSGNSITETQSSDSDIVVTVSTGATTLNGTGSPSYRVTSAGSSDVPILTLNFTASNESLNLTKLGLQLTSNTSGSTTAGDLVKVSIYDGATKVGEAYFSGSNTTATSTLNGSGVVLVKDQTKTLTIKADLADVGTNQSVTFSGHLVKIDYLNAEGTGAESGITQTLGTSAGSTSVAGVRVMKSYPTVALDTLPSTGLQDGRLLRFKVTADAKGDIYLTELNFTFATTSVTLSNVNVYVYEDAGYSTSASGLGTDGAFSTTNSVGVNWASASTNFEFTAFDTSASTTYKIPAGTTRYFQVKGSVSGVSSASSITTQLQVGSSFINGQGAASNAATNPLATSTSATFGNDFVWSPHSTSTIPTRPTNDWTGGYGVPGLSSTNLLTQTRSQ